MGEKKKKKEKEKVKEKKKEKEKVKEKKKEEKKKKNSDPRDWTRTSFVSSPILAVPGIEPGSERACCAQLV